jgi:D-lactate dehydrogenase
MNGASLLVAALENESVKQIFGVPGEENLDIVEALRRFGRDVVAHDVYRNPELEKIGVRYVELEDLLRKGDIVCLHCPLTPQTRQLINEKTLALAKPGFLLINTGRGALVDTRALIDALKNGKVGGVAMGVYEQESDLFFEDLSNEVVEDDVFQRLLTFPNLIVTCHQAFFTREALAAIAQTTLQNIADLEAGCPNSARLVKARISLSGHRANRQLRPVLGLRRGGV